MKWGAAPPQAKELEFVALSTLLSKFGTLGLIQPDNWSSGMALTALKVGRDRIIAVKFYENLKARLAICV